MGYVFISYSSANKDAAEAVRAKLLSRNIKLWMAPYDIPAGQRYAAVITNAIKECECLLLLLSDQSQASTWVDKELERALTYRKPVFPMRIDRCELAGSFEFYLGNQQIVDVEAIESGDAGFEKIISALTPYAFTAAAASQPAIQTTHTEAPQTTPPEIGYGALLHTDLHTDTPADTHTGEQASGGYGAVHGQQHEPEPSHADEEPAKIGYGVFVGEHNVTDKYGQIVAHDEELQPPAAQTQTETPSEGGYGALTGTPSEGGYGAPVG